VLPTTLGQTPAVPVWTAKTGPLASWSVQKPGPLTVGRINQEQYLSTHVFRRFWLDPLVPISGFMLWVPHLRSYSHMLLLIVIYWHKYAMLYFQSISCLDVQNKDSHAPNHILKMSVNRASTISGLASSEIWVVLDHNHPYRWTWQPWLADMYGIF